MLLPPCKICFSLQLVCQSFCSSRKLRKFGFCLRLVAAPGSLIGQVLGRPHANFLLFKAPFLVHKKYCASFAPEKRFFIRFMRPLSLVQRQRLRTSIFSTLVALHCENGVARGFLSISGPMEAKSGLDFKDLESSRLIFTAESKSLCQDHKIYKKDTEGTNDFIPQNPVASVTHHIPTGSLRQAANKRDESPLYGAFKLVDWR